MDKPLNEIMQFDHIVRVNPDGTVTDANMSVGDTGSYFDLMVDSDGTDIFEMSAGWSLLSGWTGQHGYNGPVMHPSEYIGGALEGYIFHNPGYYVVLEVAGLSDHEWQVSTFTGTKTCSRCGLLPLDDDDMQSTCQDDMPAGWAIAYKPLED